MAAEAESFNLPNQFRPALSSREWAAIQKCIQCSSLSSIRPNSRAMTPCQRDQVASSSSTSCRASPGPLSEYPWEMLQQATLICTPAVRSIDLTILPFDEVLSSVSGNPYLLSGKPRSSLLREVPGTQGPICLSLFPLTFSSSPPSSLHCSSLHLATRFDFLRSTTTKLEAASLSSSRRNIFEQDLVSTNSPSFSLQSIDRVVCRVCSHFLPAVDLSQYQSTPLLVCPRTDQKIIAG